MRKLLYILPVFLCLIACEEKIESTPLDEMVAGEWSKMTTSDTLHLLKKVSNLSLDDYGIAFLQNGDLKEIKNSGWCGTPPISYAEYQGSWEISADSILSIESHYWGGAMTMSWKIIEIDDRQMSYYLLDSYYEDFQ